MLICILWLFYKTLCKVIYLVERIFAICKVCVKQGRYEPYAYRFSNLMQQEFKYSLVKDSRAKDILAGNLK